MAQGRLSKKSISALTVPDGKADIIVFDSDLSGFGVKMSRGGSQQFIVQYRVPGQRTTKRLTIGRVDTLSIEEARRQARLALAKAQTGNDPVAERSAAKLQAALTLGSVADAYLKRAETRQKPGTFYQTRLHLARHWAPLRGMPVSKVQRIDVARRLTELADSSGAVSANRSRSALSAMFSWAIGEGLVEANPVIGTHKPAEEKSRERVLLPDELRAVWQACRDDDHGRIVRLLILTAQRREEVGGMDDAELDLNTALWTLPAKRAKNKREHIIPLSPPAVQILADKPRAIGRDLVFGEGSGGYSGWSRSKTRLDSRIHESGAAMASWTLHDLRRTASTMMAEHLGVLPHIIEAILNHSSGHRAGVAGIYNRATYLAEKREALHRWGDYVQSLAN